MREHGTVPADLDDRRAVRDALADRVLGAVDAHIGPARIGMIGDQIEPERGLARVDGRELTDRARRCPCPGFRLSSDLGAGRLAIAERFGPARLSGRRAVRSGR
jgi:hypothetical protein